MASTSVNAFRSVVLVTTRSFWSLARARRVGARDEGGLEEIPARPLGAAAVVLEVQVAAALAPSRLLVPEPEAQKLRGVVGEEGLPCRLCAGGGAMASGTQALHGRAPGIREPVEICEKADALRGPQIRLVALGDQLVARHGVREAGRAQPRAGVELMAVPRTFEITVADDTFTQRPVLVRADIGDGPQRAALAYDGNALAVDAHGGRAPLFEIGERAEEDEAVGAHGCRTIAS